MNSLFCDKIIEIPANYLVFVMKSLKISKISMKLGVNGHSIAQWVSTTSEWLIAIGQAERVRERKKLQLQIEEKSHKLWCEYVLRSNIRIAAYNFAMHFNFNSDLSDVKRCWYVCCVCVCVCLSGEANIYRFLRYTESSSRNK